MDLCFCISFGCPTSYSQRDPTPRVCPRCHNASVTLQKSRTLIEICFVPLFPISSKDVWKCNICSWEVNAGEGYEPQFPGGPGPGAPQWGGQQWGQPPPQGPYNVAPYQMTPSGQPPQGPGKPGQYQQPGYGF